MIELSKLRKLIQTIVKKMYPNCVLAIENNSVGKGLIDELRETPVSRVLYKEKKTRKIDMGVSNATRKKTIESMEYGYNTNQVTRDQMMETLESIVHNSPSHVGYRELYEEIRFLELKNGRIDHSSATHDDVVMAYMGVLWIVRYGKGLKGKGIYYSISDGSEDYDEITYDTMESIRLVNKLLRGGKDEKKDAEDELIDYMLRDHPIYTSDDLAKKEKENYFRAMDRVEGITDDDDIDFQVSDPTKNLLLKNYHQMLRMDLYSDDPMESLLRPVGMRDSGFGMPGFGNDWSDDYKF